MDHVVYLDAEAKELDMLAQGKKSMLIRGAPGRKVPYGLVNPGDCLFFIQTGETLIRASAVVQSVVNSKMLSDEGSIEMLIANQGALWLTEKQVQRWAGKRYLVLIAVQEFKLLEPLTFDRTAFSDPDDWLLVADISKVVKST
jgi:hypothetical protein